METMKRVDLVDARWERTFGRRDVFRCSMSYKGTKLGEISGNIQADNTMMYYSSVSLFHFCWSERGTIASIKYAFEKVWNENGCPLPKKEKKQFNGMDNAASLEDNGNKDFCPISSKIAGKICTGLNSEKNEYILIPTAGDGVLVDCIARHQDRHAHLLRIECIERSENLRELLKSNEYKVIHDDFFAFNGSIDYDIVIINPPFSESMKYLVKAIELQKNGGRVCCVLNAEDIKHPVTNNQKALCNLLEQHNANISYVPPHVSRNGKRIHSEYAIAWITIPEPNHVSSVIENVKNKFEITEDLDTDSISGMIKSYNFNIGLCKAFVNEYQCFASYFNSDINGKDYPIPLVKMSFCDNSSFDFCDCVREIRNKYWTELIQNKYKYLSSLTSSMAIIMNNIKIDMNNYDFDIFNVNNAISRVNAGILGQMKQSVIDVFNRLTEENSECDNNMIPFNGWETDKAGKVGMKVVLKEYNLFSNYSFDRGGLELYRAYDAISDIEKVFSYFDGSYSNGDDIRLMLRIANTKGITKNITFKYFTASFYKKGTIRLVMHPETEWIIDALNIYVARVNGWLPSHYGELEYDELTEEERAVIDDFQGRDKYEAVMRNKDLYIYNEEKLGNKLMFPEII